MGKTIQVACALSLAAISPLAAAATPTPTLGDMLQASGISVTGYLDSSYNYLSGSGLFTSGVPDRVFDAQHNSFNVNMLDLKVQSTPTSGVGGVFEVNAGSDAGVIAPYPYAGTSHEFDVQQAYLQDAIGPLTVIAGKFVTLAGAEVITSPNDVNFSRSILFGYAIPFTHTGVRAIYTLSPIASVTLGVNNGWDQLTTPMGPKTIEAGVSVTPVKPLNLVVSYYGGNEYVNEPATNMAAGPSGNRQLLDVVATYTVSQPLTVTLNYDVARQDNYNGLGAQARWDGLAGYVTYQFTSQWQAAIRAEYFNDPQGYRTGVVQKWKEGTVTVSYLPTAAIELRGEFREDKSNVPAFLETNGTATDTQHSVALEALYKF